MGCEGEEVQKLRFKPTTQSRGGYPPPPGRLKEAGGVLPGFSDCCWVGIALPAMAA